MSYPRAHYKARVEYSGGLGKLRFFAQICPGNLSLFEGAEELYSSAYMLIGVNEWRG